MSRTLTIGINRDAVHAIDPRERTFEPTDSFTIDLENEGQATHVHLHLDDELAKIAHLPRGNNYFVEAESTSSVPVEIDGGRRPVNGRLKIVTGYGSETGYVDVTVRKADEDSTQVRVDDRLSKKQPKQRSRYVIDSATTAVLGLALFAIILAAGALLIIGSSAVLLGVAVVFVAVVLAGYLLLR